MAIKNKKVILGGLTLALIINALTYQICKTANEKKELENLITKIESKMTTLDKQIKEKDKKIEDLNNQLDELNNKYNDMEEKNKKLESENSSLKTKLSNISNSKYNVSSYEKSLLEKLVYCEARGESQSGQIAVVNVVLNRLNNDEFPDTVSEVIYQKGQFSPVGNGAINYAEPNEEIKESVEKALNGSKVVSDDTVYFFATYLDSDHPIRSHVQVTKTIGIHNFGK